MIGVPFNPNNCLFVFNQASNANQFRGTVPDTSNLSNHTVLWDFIERKLYWVNTLTNIIEREITGNAGDDNESYEVFSQNNTFCYIVQPFPLVFGDNYLLLPAGTYIFDLEFDIYPIPDTYEGVIYPLYAEIRTNTNQSITTASITDVVEDSRTMNTPFIEATSYPLNLDSNITILNQTVCTGPVTFTSPFIVKSVFSIAFADIPISAINNIQLRALLVK